MFAPVTKWSKQIVQPDSTAEIVRKAFSIAQAEKPGAVHIDLPENVAAMEAHGRVLASHRSDATFASFNSIETAALLINRARHPLVLVGNGAIRGRASAAISEFATKLNLPVANSFMGKGVIPYTSPLSLWSVGLQQRDFITCGFEHADLVIVVGYDAIEYSPKKWNPQGDLTIIHIGALPAEIDSSYIPQVEVVGDISDSLREILGRCDRSQLPPPYGLALKTAIQEDYEYYATDEGFPIRPQKLVYDLRQVLGDEDILISDVGAHKMWIARHYHCVKPNTCIISNGFAAMGIAIPGAIAAKLVHPERQVIAATGDGGFMMNMQELETALRLNVAFVTLVFNDGGYGLIEWKQMQRFGSAAFVKFTNPDFVKLAESMGLKGYRIDSADRLIPTIQEALAQPVPTVIDCPVDYRENLLFSKRSGALTCAVEASGSGC